MNQIGTKRLQYTVKKAPKSFAEAMHSKGSSNAFAWVFQQVEEVYILELDYIEGDLHAVVVVAFRGVVIDPSEMKALR